MIAADGDGDQKPRRKRKRKEGPVQAIVLRPKPRAPKRRKKEEQEQEQKQEQEPIPAWYLSDDGFWQMDEVIDSGVLPNSKKLIAISLFSGCGGDTLGMKQAGVDVKYFSEIDIHAILSHSHNFPDSELLVNPEILKTQKKKQAKMIENIPDDIFRQIGDIDFIFAGFPCQSFSSAGKRRADDKRGALWKEAFRVVRICKPKFVICENVKNILTAKNENGDNVVNEIKTSFESIGYTVKWKVLNSENFGVAQNRERWFMVAVNNDLNIANERINIPESNGAEKTTIREVIGSQPFSLMNAMKMTDEMENSVPDGKFIEDLENKEEPSGDFPKGREKTIFGKSCGWTMRQILDIDGLCPTVTYWESHDSSLVISVKNANGKFIRILTAEEYKLLQGFPPSFKMMVAKEKQKKEKDLHRRKVQQIGNSVPPPIVKAIVEHLKSLI